VFAQFTAAKVEWTWQGKPDPQLPIAETVRLASPLNPTGSNMPVSTSFICQEQVELETCVQLYWIVMTVPSHVAGHEAKMHGELKERDAPFTWIE